MQYIALGRTGLKVSVMGLGCGGHSRLGQKTGNSENESISIIRKAHDFGINFFDTAKRYGTEEILGKGIKEIGRDNIILSTKGHISNEGLFLSGPEMVTEVEQSLMRLKTEYIDIYYLHGLRPDHYSYAVAEIVPALLKLRDQGKIRFIGVSESFHRHPDTQHKMLVRALNDNCWDVFMVGFNMLNQSARERVFVDTIKKNIGVIVMYAARRALSRPERLKEIMSELRRKKIVTSGRVEEDNPLGFLCYAGGAINIPDAAYRFCRYEPGVHVVLSGTGSLEHLAANVDSFLRPSLPGSDLLRLRKLFAAVDGISGN